MSAPGTLDLAGIRAKAKAATPGPWFVTGDPWFRSNDGVLAGSPDGNIGFVIVDCEAIGAQRDEYEGPLKLSTAEADAAYVATMDPPTTLALVDEVERLRFEADHDDGSFARLFRTCARSQNERDAAEAEVAKLRARVAELEGRLDEHLLGDAP